MDSGVSIGEVTASTGLSPDVIRVWERRYGFPVPERLPSGHRRYSTGDLQRLRWIAMALARGLRPARVVPMAEEELRGLLSIEVPPPVEGILGALRALDSGEVRRQLHEACQTQGLLPFLCEVVSPLLERVGSLWVEGLLEVQHEHLLTEILEDLLRSLRSGFRPRPGASTVALATLPGERHRLGLLMAALAYAAQGNRVEMLGTDLPLASLASGTKALEAQTLGISVSLAGGGELAQAMLKDLRERLPASIQLVVGGQGAARLRRMAGITYVRGLEAGR